MLSYGRQFVFDVQFMLRRRKMAGFEKKKIDAVSPGISDNTAPFPEKLIIQEGDFFRFPGFCDVHVHFREPGFSYKETIKTGTMAAAHGGYTAVCPMPNLDPVPDSVSHLKIEQDIIERDAVINVYPYGALTAGEKGLEMADLKGMAPGVAAFSDDGHGVQNREMMKKAMLEAKSLGKIVAAHCEDNSLLKGGYINDGKYAKEHGHKGICSESEWGQIARDVQLAAETGVSYHVCHVSAKESVEIIRQAKADGVDITCETAPHYLVLTENDLKEDGRFKMNPPLRSSEDRAALIEGIKDGTIDMIATDHAPHSKEEKAKGLAHSAMGITGIELAFPVLYTKLVKEGVISLEKLLELLVIAPRKRFKIPLSKDDYTIWDLTSEFTADPDEFISMGKATPFEGMRLYGRCIETVCAGKTVYRLNA